MAGPFLFDRVKETSDIVGVGTATLNGAQSGFITFAVIGDGNTTYYAIVHRTANEWEVGLGTYTLAGTLLARTTVLASSNSNLAVNFSAGTKDVFVTAPASLLSLIGAAGAPTTADYLVGTTQGGLSAEIVVGLTPGGELGGTWGAPTVDAVHSGSSHAAIQAAAEATAASLLAAHEIDVTNIHGIADTSLLETLVGAQAKVDAHVAASDPHPQYLRQSEADLLYQPVGSYLDGSGTAGKIPKWSDSNTLTDSILSESGTIVTAAGSLAATGTANTLTMAGSTTGNPVTLTATGSDSKVSIQITPKITGSSRGSIFLDQYNATIQNFETNQGHYPVYISSPDGQGAGLLLMNSAGTPFFTGMRFNGTYASPTAVVNNNGLFNLAAIAYDGSDPTFAGGIHYPAAIEFRVDGPVSAGVIPGAIDFMTIASGDIDYADPQMILRSTGALYIKSLTASQLVATDASKNLVSLPLNTYQTLLTNSAGLLAALSDETGTGLAVFNTTPTLVTPVLGVASGTSLGLTSFVRVGDGSAAAPSLSFTNDTDTGFYRGTANQVELALAGVRSFSFSVTGGVRELIIAGDPDSGVAFLNAAFSVNQTKLIAEGVGLLAQRRATDAQALREYNTGDSSNGDWLEIGFKNATNFATLVSKKAGTGTVRPMILGQTTETTRIRSSLVTPGTLVDGDIWVESSGTTPTKTCSIMARVDGATRTIATSAAF
jgi:hypothetical protein